MSPGGPLAALPVMPERQHAPPPLLRVWLLTAALAGALYLPTTAPGLLWGDSGEAHVRVLLGQFTDLREIARTHITYYAPAILLHRLGLDAAWAANLLSALAGVATIANFACLLALLVHCYTTLISGVALLALSHTLWQLSSGAECVTFSTMCLTAELLALVRFMQTSRKPLLYLTAFLNGIGWTTHNFALLMWPAYVVLTLRNARTARFTGCDLLLTGLAWLTGVAPLIVLFALEVQRLGAWTLALRSLLVGGYSGEVFNASISLGTFARLAAYVLLNFPTPLLLLAPLGWWRLRERPTRELWLFLTIGGATYLAFAARYNVPDAYTFLTPSYVFLMLFTALGVRRLLASGGPLPLRVALLLASCGGPLLYATAPVILPQIAALRSAVPQRTLPYRDPFEWFLTPWRGGYDGAERFARAVFAELPPQAWLLVDSTARRPLDYLQLRDGLRRDVALVTENHVRLGEAPIVLDAASALPLARAGQLFCVSDAAPYRPAWLSPDRFELAPRGLIFQVRVKDQALPGADSP